MLCADASFVAALLSECGHYIFRSVVSSSIFLFFLDYSQPSQTGRLPYFHTWCGLSANFGCRYETCCTWLVENTERKKIA